MPATENLRTGERRNVTVLFADMQGFTSLSERMDPEEMDGLMTRIYGAFESIVKRYGGTVEKYIGDALVAVFGVPTLHEDDPARAISAAVDYLAEIAVLNETRHGDAIAFRVGVNTGLITTGRRGEHEVVTGHAMAVASRLETSARTNTVLVSESTRDRCENEFLFSDQIVVRAKGKDEVVRAFEVRGRNPRPDESDLVFIGRRSLLDRLLRAFLRHDASRAEGMVVVGEAGIGKTRLVREFIRTIEQLPDFRQRPLYARAQRYRARPFSVVIDLLSSYFRLDAQMSADDISTVVRNELQVESRTAAGFASLVKGTAEEQDNQAFVILYLILKSIVKLNEEAPYATVLCIDDLHFIDQSSRDFFQFYLRNADVHPFFLLLDRTLDTSFGDIFRDLEVAEITALGPDETLQLVRELANDDLDSEMVNSIRENARGNPLFVREYVRYARENRDAQALPSTIQNIFLTSIESYSTDLRDLLKKLSVFAHSFSIQDARHIQELTHGDPELVKAAIGFFLREGILVQEDELFMFRYDLFKKALYNSLLNYNKRILHRVIANLMQSKGQPHPMRLLHHLLRAEEYDRATEALADSPNATSNVEYLSLIDQLLEHYKEQDFDRYMKMLFLKSAILFNNGITEEADSLLKGIIEMAVQKCSPLYAGSAYHLLTAYNMKAYCFGKARYCGRKALAHYSRAGSESGRMQNVLEIMASSELLCNKAEDLERIVAEVRELESREGTSFSRNRLSLSLAEHHLIRGEYRKAIDLLSSIVTEVSTRSDTWYGVYLMLGLAYFLVCDWEEMKHVDQIVLEGPSRHLSNISQIHARMAVAHHFLGDATEADRRLQQAEFNASQIRNDFDLVDAYRTLSGSYLLRGDVERARRYAVQGLSTSLRHSATYPVLTLLMILVEAALAEDGRAAAEFYLQEADLLVESGVLLPNRDLVFYHYYRMKLAVADAPAESHRTMAIAALEREIASIGDERLVERLAKVRNIEWIRRELLDPAGSPGPA